ncbi:hypothetical protein [Methanoplanus limicola]|uniref:hypothetical protein n=1 Tax=Methanoplanus limicola TaxID=2315 RepID=UPI0012F6F0DA|nr:hypothetical protein [Methanoplanus limicola]
MQVIPVVAEIVEGQYITKILTTEFISPAYTGGKGSYSCFSPIYNVMNDLGISVKT